MKLIIDIGNTRTKLAIFNYNKIIKQETVSVLTVKEEFDFTFNDIFLFGIVLNITAGLGAFLLGILDDIVGGKKTIQISNIGLIGAA